jgi:hypothetical protein
VSNQNEAIKNDMNAGWAILFWLIIIFAGCYLLAGDIDPEPVEVKPTIAKAAYQWDLTKAYYCRVKMPDGSNQELKSARPLTERQWLELAEKVYVKPEPMPKLCPYCGQPLPEGFVP